jgi:2-oxoglutarate ferredoxin oxidoreductase subunit gamma
MRGGRTEASVVVADSGLRSLPILPSAGSAYVMHQAHWAPVRDRLRPGAVVVLNSTVVSGEQLAEREDLVVIELPAAAMAAEAGAPMTAGFVLLGGFVSATNLVDVQAVVEAMRELVPPYRREHIAANEAAIRAGAAGVRAASADLWQAVAA